MGPCGATTHWRPGESSLCRESFNTLVRRRKLDTSSALVSANRMSRQAMMAHPMVGTRAYSSPSIGLSSARSSSTTSLPMVNGAANAPARGPVPLRAVRSLPVPPIALAPINATAAATGGESNQPMLRKASSKSSIVSISSQKGDGFGSIRLGTPTVTERPDRKEQMRRKHAALCGGAAASSGSSAASRPARHGFMPAEAGRITRTLQDVADAAGMSMAITQGVDALFRKMDIDGDGLVTREEAQSFFRSFGKVSANAMFAEVDEDRNDYITFNEFLGFWKQVQGSGYAEDDLIEELELLTEGNAWVDFLDDRQVGYTKEVKDVCRSVSAAP